MKKLFFVLACLFSVFSLSACYIASDVETNQVGVKLDSNTIQSVVSSGVYTELGFFADLKTIDISAQTFTIEDPEVITKDNQAVGLTITVQVQRNRDEESVKNLVTNWSALIDNQVMIDTVSVTAKEGMKNGTRNYTLTQLLDDRNGLSTAIKEQLDLDTARYGVSVLNVTIENVAIDPEYMAMLNQKALLRAETEKELQRQELIKQQADNDILQAQSTTKVLDQQLEQAKAQTALEVEIASREGKKIAEANKVYETNYQAFVLEQLRLLKEIYGDSTVFYIPEGTSLMQVLGFNGNSALPLANPQ